MRRRLALLAGVALVVGLVAPSVATANHSWSGYHWERSSNPLSLDLADNVDSTWGPMLDLASQDWSASSVLNTRVVSHGANPTTCAATLGRVEVCNASYGNTGWLGVAQIWIYRVGKHIAQGTVKVNDTYHSQPPYNSTAWRQYVMCQEVGHTFGLGHQDENQTNANLGSCMDYTNDPDGGPGGASDSDPDNTQPNIHDYAQLESIYSHGDGRGSKPRGPKNSRGAAGIDASAWGLEVAQASGGRTSVYLRDIGDGWSVVTFVIWA